jgi:hypothetical protein
MKIQEAAIPPDIEAVLPEILPEVVEYLELEDAGFNPRDVRYSTYFTVNDSVGFVVFDYTADESPDEPDKGPPFAFLQYSVARGVNSGCIGNWARTEGRTLSWSIAKYFEMNPIDEQAPY